MNKKQQQNFYPISMLPTFIGQIDQLIETLIEKYKLFTKAKDNPASLDDNIVNRALKIFQKNSTYIGLYNEQLIKWQKEILSDTQKTSLDNFAKKVSHAQELNTQLVDLTKELKELTINRILEKDDFELGLDFLSKNLKDTND